MFEKEAEEYTVENVCSSCYFEKPCENKCEAFGCADSKTYVLKAFKDGAEFGYNKAKEEMQGQEFNLRYENGIYKYKDKSGKEFESTDGKTWKEIVLPELPKEIE